MKKSKTIYFTLTFLQFFILGGLLGYYLAICETEVESFCMMMVLGLGYLITMFVSNALHELGHLIGGLLSKYDFFMYSVGGFSIYKDDNNKFKLTRSNIAGAGGFVSMIPRIDSGYRVFLYGGITVNFIISVLSVVLLLLTSNIYLNSFLTITVLYNVSSFILNFLPLQVANVSTDGMKIKDLDNNVYKLEDYVRQSKFDKVLLLGYDYKDVDISEFNLPDKIETYYEKGDFSSYLCKLIREDRFEDALKLLDDYNITINYKADDISDLEVTYEMIFLKLMLDKVENIDELFTKENINFARKHGMQLVFAANRCLYIYYLLKSESKNAEKIIKLKNNLLKKTFKSQVPYENHLYELIDKKYKNK